MKDKDVTYNIFRKSEVDLINAEYERKLDLLLGEGINYSELDEVQDAIKESGLGI